MAPDFIGYLNTLLRYHLSIDPDTLTDAQWAQTIAHLKVIREQEAKNNAV